MRETPWDKTTWLERQLDRGSITVAEEAGILVGFAAWNYEFASLPCIWLVIVSHEYRGRGIASSLFSFVERRCQGLRLYSSTNKSNMRMRWFFEKRGYRQAGEVDIDPGDPEIFYRIDL